MTLTSSYKRDISVKFYFYIIKVTLATFMSTITVVDVAHSEILELNFAYADLEQPPYIYGEGKDIPINPGVVVDMLKIVDQRMPGLKINFVRLSWKRCLQYLHLGNVDGIFNASFLPERLQNGVYPTLDGQPDLTKRLVTISYGIYTLDNSLITWDGQNFMHLNGLVGVNRGFSVISNLKKMGVPLQEVDSVSQNFLKLQLGRIEAVLAQNVTAYAVLQKQDRFKGISQLSIPFITKPYYLMLSHQFVKKHREVAEQIWKEIENVREAEFDNLMANYTIE